MSDFDWTIETTLGESIRLDSQADVEDPISLRTEILALLREPIGRQRILRVMSDAALGMDRVLDDEAICDYIISGVRRGVLRISHRARRDTWVVDLPPAAVDGGKDLESDAGGPAAIQTHWVELELVDMEDNPVPNERYCITLPDGSKHEGRTGSSGIVYVRSDVAGSCQLTFPDLDQEAWEPA